MDSRLKGRFPNLNQSQGKQVLSFYHDCMLRVFDNHASRKSAYLGNVLLSTAKSGDVKKLCKALEKVDLNKVDFNLRERNTENTPLIVAAEYGHDEIIQILLCCGSDVTLRNSGGQTVLDNASERITELILDSVNRPGAGQPLLFQAAWQGNVTIVKKLLKLNPNLNVNNKNSEGFTPLLLVTRNLDFFDKIKLNVFLENYNPTEVVSLLLHQNADFTAVDNEGRSALHLTSKNHGTNARIIASLLARKDSLDVDLHDIQEYTALHCASETGDPNVLLTLIDNGADVNARGPLGRTPLHMTASRGDEKSSGILVEHGANVLLVDDLGFSAVDIATGNNVQLLLKEAWSEHSQRSVDSFRVRSAPVSLPVMLDHVDTPDVSKKDDESEETLKKTSKKNSKRLSSRSHSEEQTQAFPTVCVARRTRSYSSGPSPQSKLEPINKDVFYLQPNEGPVSSFTQKTNLSKTNQSETNITLSKSPPIEVAPRPFAKVAVLNIDLKGHDLHRQKSKSCSELPFTRHRVQKLSNVRSSMEVEPSSNPLSLRGRSLSVAVLSSFETIPDITRETAGEEVEEAERVSNQDPKPVPQKVLTPPAVEVDYPPDNECASSPETDIMNKTFDSMDKPVFWFPSSSKAQEDTKSSSMVKNCDRGFFVDWNKLEIPLEKCTKCHQEFKPESFKPGTSICNLCFRESIGKDIFWVPFGPTDRKAEAEIRTGGHNVNSGNGCASSDDRNVNKMLVGTGSSSVDDKTVCIDKETLSILRKKECVEGSLSSGNCSQNVNKEENIGGTKQILKKTVDILEIQKSLRRVKTDIEYGETSTIHGTCVNRVTSESPTEQLPNNFETINKTQCQDSTINHRELAVKDDSKNLDFSEKRDENEKTDIECGKQRKSRSLLGQVENTGQFKRERKEFDISLDNQPENGWQRITTENAETPKQNDVRETPGLSAENVATLVDNKLALKNLLESAQRKNCQHNFISCKEFEESDQVLRSLIANHVSLEASGKSDPIGQLGDQSANQSALREIWLVNQSLADGGKSVSTLSEKTEPVVKDENVECCGEIMNNHDHKKLSHESSKASSMEANGDEGCVGVGIDRTGYRGVEMDKYGSIMDKPACLRREHFNTDFTSHQVVIVNPFPSPVPPKVPMVNVTSNCQCDRFISLAKNSEKGGKKKGRGKKTGASCQKSEQSGRETWTGKNAKVNNQKLMGKTKKTSREKDKEAGKICTIAKQSVRIVSAGNKSKKKLKNSSDKILKEVSVVQPNLKTDLTDRNESTKPNNSEDIFDHDTVSTPVRQATFVKEQFSVLSPIPETSRSGSSVPGSLPDVFPLKSGNNDDISSTEGPSVSDSNTEIDSSLKKDLNNKGNIHDENVAPSHPVGNDSTEANSEPRGRNSEIDDNLDEIIEGILNETDEVEKYRTKSDVLEKTKTHIGVKIVTESENAHAHYDIPIDQSELMKNSRNNFEIEFHSKDALVSNWIREQNLDDLNIMENHQSFGGCISSGSAQDSTEYNQKSFLSDTFATESSYGSSGSTPRPHKTELSSDHSALCNDTTYSDFSLTNVFHNDDGGKLGTSLEALFEKTFSGTRSENWSSSSGTISLPTADEMSVEKEADNSGVVVRSRISRRKSETSGTSSEMMTSEEEEIVWRKGNLLGKGAFGKVYCGLTNTGQMIAVKQVELITSNMEEAERQYEKLQREVALLKSLRHVNIVSYLGTCLDGGVVNIFMQFVPGGSIASILARFGPLEERVFRYYTKQILVGVDYLHQNNVVHRDIKGGNIMLMSNGVIKLIDFGCAKRLYMSMSQSQEDLLRSMKGTPYWMAPEVIKETGYGRKSDIWSIGCTVFEMATGKPPWSHLPPMSAILAIGQGSESPKLEKPNSDDACDFVHNSMARDPDERWSAEELLKHPFILHCNDQR